MEAGDFFIAFQTVPCSSMRNFMYKADIEKTKMQSRAKEDTNRKKKR